MTRYLKIAESAMFDRADRLLPLRAMNPLKLTVRNLTDYTLGNVELIMKFCGHGQLQLVDSEPPDLVLTELPEAPRPLGSPTVNARLAPSARNALAAANTAISQVQRSNRYGSRTSFTGARIAHQSELITTELLDDGGFELGFPTFDLRAGQTYDLPAFALDIFEPHGTVCRLSWRATSRSRPGVSNGVILVETVESMFDLNRLSATLEVLPDQRF